jgi:hypothetical protein
MFFFCAIGGGFLEHCLYELFFFKWDRLIPRRGFGSVKIEWFQNAIRVLVRLSVVKPGRWRGNHSRSLGG